MLFHLFLFARTRLLCTQHGHCARSTSGLVVCANINQLKWSRLFRQTHQRGKLLQNTLLMSVFDDFYILFLNNSSKLCTKRFGRRQPVLCWTPRINSSQWRRTQWHHFKTSERSWTGAGDTKVVMTDVLRSTSWFPTRQSTCHSGATPREGQRKTTRKANFSELKKENPWEKQWPHKSARTNSCSGTRT